MTTADETSMGRREFAAACCVITVIALLFTLPMLRCFGNWGTQDWDAWVFMSEASRLTILQYHQVPLWNPYYCGGTYLLACPISRCLSPFYLLDMSLGEAMGFQVQIVIFLVLQMLGVYLLARHLGLADISAYLAAALFSLNGAFSFSLVAGMGWFLSWMYLPWIFLFYLKGVRDGRYAVLAGIGLVLMFFEGGHYTAPLTAAFLAIHGITEALLHRTVRPLRALAILLATTFLLGAVKILPGACYLSRFPRGPIAQEYVSGYTPRGLLGMMTDRHQTWDTVSRYLPLGMTFGMNENGMYIGVIPIALCALGLLRFCRRRAVLILCLLLSLWLSLGDLVSPSVWKLLRLLPVYNSMRVAQRFRIPFLLCAALFAGMGFQAARDLVLRATLHPRLFRVLATAVALAIAGDLVLLNSVNFRDAFPVRPVKTVREPLFFQTRDYAENISLLKRNDPLYFTSDDLNLYAACLSNIGTINCNSSEYNGPRAAVPRSSPGYRGETWVSGPRGHAEIVSWSPNRVRVRAVAAEGGYLVLNQNYDTGWKARRISPSPGTLGVENRADLATVRVEKGESTVEFYYRPLSFVAGAIISAAALAGILVIFLRRRPL